jgi:transposase InsO family protein
LTAQGHPRTTFNRAIERGNLLVAEATAREIGKVSLGEALELVALIAQHALRVYIRHYNEHRPHRSLTQRPPIEEPPPGSETDVDLDHVRRRDLLGGLIHEYKATA